MTVALVVISDRRDQYLDGRRHQYLERCLASIAEHVRYPFAHLRLVDDSGSGKTMDVVPTPGAAFAVGWDVISHPERRGLAAAVGSAWAGLPAEIDYVFHVEEDYVFVAPVDVDAMALTLKGNPRLAQVVLKRQAWSPEERAAGGIIEMHPDHYVAQDTYIEHRRIFSLNPCLIPREVVDMGWPAGNEAEMTERLVERGWSFGFWGQKTDEPRCLHIGVERSAGWSP